MGEKENRRGTHNKGTHLCSNMNGHEKTSEGMVPQVPVVPLPRRSVGSGAVAGRPVEDHRVRALPADASEELRQRNCLPDTRI